MKSYILVLVSRLPTIKCHIIHKTQIFLCLYKKEKQEYFVASSTLCVEKSNQELTWCCRRMPSDQKGKPIVSSIQVLEENKSVCTISLISPEPAQAKQTPPLCQDKHTGLNWRGQFFKDSPSSINFLRSRYKRAFLKKYGTATLKKAWIQPRHYHLSPSMLFKGVFAQTFVIITCHFHQV